MLISIILTLTTPVAVSLPAHLGRANYAATLACLQELDPALGPALHEGEGPKPLTCSDLQGGRIYQERRHIAAGETCYVRITGLTQLASEALVAALLSEPPATWSLGGQPFTVVGAGCDETQDRWSGHTTYETLAAQQLFQGERLDTRVTLLFHSPTSFQSKGMHMPVPLPNLVFGSLVDRWNRFSPVTLSPEMRQYAEEAVALSSYQLESQVVVQKGGAPLIGGVGRATYTALGGDRYWLATLHMLADFALYSGVGVKTTMGMGQVRRV